MSLLPPPPIQEISALAVEAFDRRDHATHYRAHLRRFSVCVLDVITHDLRTGDALPQYERSKWDYRKTIGDEAPDIRQPLVFVKC